MGPGSLLGVQRDGWGGQSRVPPTPALEAPENGGGPARCFPSLKGRVTHPIWGDQGEMSTEAPPLFNMRWGCWSESRNPGPP